MSNVFKSEYDKELERELNNQLIEHAKDIAKINGMDSYVNNISELYLHFFNSKNIKLLKGIYTLTSSITAIANNIDIIGQEGTIIDGNNLYGINKSGLQNVTFRNITFTKLTTISLPSLQRVRFIDCKFTNIRLSAISADLFYKLAFYNCEFDGAGLGTIEPTWQGMGVYATNGDYVTVDNCKLSGSRGHGALFFVAATNISVRHNEIHDTAYRGIELYLEGNSGEIYNNYIYNCGSINTAIPVSGVGCNGIFGSGANPNLNIRENTIRNVYENGIEGNFGNVENNLIDGTGIDLVNFPTPSPEGIYASSGKIYNNTIRNAGGRGIYAYKDGAISDLEISYNKIIGYAASATEAIGLNSTTSYTNVTIRGNICDGTKPCLGRVNRTSTNYSSADNRNILGYGTAFSGTTGWIYISFGNSTTKALTPTGGCTVFAALGNQGQECTMIVTTSGTSSYNIDFNHADGNIIATGSLATGTASGKVFTISFICGADGKWYEKCRTAAM